MKIVAYANTPAQAQSILIKMLRERAARFDDAGKNKTEQRENTRIAQEMRFEASWLEMVEFQPMDPR